MNAKDVLKYGHLDVMRAIQGVKDSDWEKVGVTPLWSIKDHIGHLAAFERVLEDVFTSILDSEKETSYLNNYRSLGGESFNDTEAEIRKSRKPKDVVSEYSLAALRVQKLAEVVPLKTFTKIGTLPWYGKGYSLDDYIVYANYGHKQGHLAQITAFREKL
jgi:hypothetical protein